ncbi:hypothetical protein CPB85DRAFT_1432180 [Mucidula mucida]|nr:hypothetical protein CPB85DRAFT_1432180 [Mucidula mucida]
MSDSRSHSPAVQRSRGRSRNPRSLSVREESASPARTDIPLEHHREDRALQQQPRRQRRRHSALGGMLHAGGEQAPMPLPGQGAPQESGKDTLKLRLDLNLDVEVTIKAKVHGDVTLSLL